MCGKIACTVRWGVAGDGATATAPAAYPTDQVQRRGAGGLVSCRRRGNGWPGRRRLVMTGVGGMP